MGQHTYAEASMNFPGIFTQTAQHELSLFPKEVQGDNKD